MKVFLHLGGNVPDYRGIMREQGDFVIEGKRIPADRVVIAEQTHSDLAHRCGEEDGGAGFGSHPQIPIADALITDVAGLYLLIRTADCTPVLLYDEACRAVGAVHSGREGTRKNIAGKTVQQLRQDYGIQPKDLLAWVGAGICARHYEVDAATWSDYHESLQAQGFSPQPAPHRHIDIGGDICQQLAAAGIPPRNIFRQEICTLESPHHFSWRRDGTRNRQINLIGIEYE